MSQYQKKQSQACGCCEGIEKLTPLPTANRPGLDSLKYRVGTHATFLETMQASLTGLCLEPENNRTDGRQKRLCPLRALTTREAGDPAIALLDAWAAVAAVLTFYQERIANEGYLRTATERRSILELARLIGYDLQPGVAASVYLAFTLEDGQQVEIPAGTQARSKPGPGESPQTFETSQPLAARAAWNELKPRLTKPYRITGNTLYFQGTTTNLEPNDPLLIVRTTPMLRRVKKVEPDQAANRTKVTLQSETPVEEMLSTTSSATTAMPESLHATNLRTVVKDLSDVGDLSTEQLEQVVEQFATALLTAFVALAKRPPSTRRTEVIRETTAALHSIRTSVDQIMGGISPNAILAQRLGQVQSWSEKALAVLQQQTVPMSEEVAVPDFAGVVTELLQPAPAGSIPPQNAVRLERDVQKIYGATLEGGRSDANLQLLTNLQPALQSKLYPAWRSLVSAESGGDTKVYALRVKASLFGHNAPKQPQYEQDGTPKPMAKWPDPSPDEKGTVVFLDGEYDNILAGPESHIVVQKPGKPEQIFEVKNVNIQSRSAYGISAKTTRITLPEGKSWSPPAQDPKNFSVLRETRIYAQSELLELAEEPLDPIIDFVGGDTVILDDVYEGFQSGQWLIVSGERLSERGVAKKAPSGIRESELVMLASVKQIIKLGQPQNRPYTELRFANQLAHAYKRDTVTIHGNVVKATHGETREEVLGSGDGSQARQQFELKKSPLTYLPAPTPDGTESTLEVRVNEVKWPESDNLFELEPSERGYITRTDNEDVVTVVFGDGTHGARLPTGIENVRAVYRKGIGKPGNVNAEQISLLASRPLGVKGVINPLPATGGANRERRDQARRNAPLAVMALDRLVSVQDYADFARTFAGIGKASAKELSDGQQEVVHLTIAGADDIPIKKSSDLYRNLQRALQEVGDPHQPVQIDIREHKSLFIEARIRVLPDYQWESVAPDIRAALLDAFSFQRRQLGQDVVRSEVISVIQHVPGVAYVDLETLDSVPQDIDPDKLENLADRFKSENQPSEWIIVNLATVDPKTLDPDARLKPAQIAYLKPDVPDTLILNVIE